MKRNIIVWGIAILITITAAIFQRSTGPTYPKKYSIETSQGEYKFKLKRSQTIGKECFIELKDAPEKLTGKLIYRPFPTDNEWIEVDFERDGSIIKAKLPEQPAAGKLEYYLVLNDGKKDFVIAKDETVKIRFKGDVPAWFMIPHILCMFLAMLFANLTGILVIFKDKRFKKYLKLAFYFLVAGGAILGPIIQKYAFGAYWTGFPFGLDLTDNKTLISLIFFSVAFFANLKKDRPWLALVAVIVLLLVYSIPHSMFGSELNHASGQIVSG
jgi:hypothetical protein